ncbi:MAG: Gfo/Idh/MocA family oxidoreductase [Verrucomicrobia bacterium]|nr:Gfo/Idh/MocA family oxidoreductase [Verrucomicrobiota bacterium]
MSQHSILVVGCGSIGERHLRCFQATARATVTACEQNPALLQRMADTYRVPGVADWQAAVRSGQPTAVVICTPAPLHVPIAGAALAAGMHVLIEKPLSHSLAGVEELLAAHARSQRQAAVAYVLHVFPFLAEAQAFLARGELGPVRQVSVLSGQPFHLLRPAYAQTYYRDRRTGGGAIQDALTHSANWIESVLGPTESVLCDCAHLALPDVEVEDTVHVSARHRDGVLASYALNQFQHPNETSFQLNCVAGSLRIELHAQRWGVFRAGDAGWTWHDARVADRDAHFIAQANAFLDQIEGRPPRLCSLEAAAHTLRFNLAALASAASGTRVNCASLHA